MSIISQNIYRIIKEKCLSQSAIGRRAGYDIKKFNAMLRGRKIIKAEDIPIIANALGVEPGELFRLEEAEKSQKGA